MSHHHREWECVADHLHASPLLQVETEYCVCTDAVICETVLKCICLSASFMSLIFMDIRGVDRLHNYIRAVVVLFYVEMTGVLDPITQR
jgi:hypothetical protein